MAGASYPEGQTTFFHIPANLSFIISCSHTTFKANNNQILESCAPALILPILYDEKLRPFQF